MIQQKKISSPRQKEIESEFLWVPTAQIKEMPLPEEIKVASSTESVRNEDADKSLQRHQ